MAKIPYFYGWFSGENHLEIGDLSIAMMGFVRFVFFIGDSLENQSPWNFQLTSRYQVVNHGLQFTWAPAGL
jgi:hypothetical protein